MANFDVFLRIRNTKTGHIICDKQYQTLSHEVYELLSIIAPTRAAKFAINHDLPHEPPDPPPRKEAHP
jgi:hypothetical protein